MLFSHFISQEPVIMGSFDVYQLYSMIVISTFIKSLSHSHMLPPLLQLVFV